MVGTRVGVIGCGFFAGNHLNAWTHLASKGVELVAVCDMDQAKAAEAAATFGVAGVYRDAATMLAEANLDLVDIVTQVRSHKPLVELSLKVGVPTIVQKPFGLNLDDCIEMRDLSERLGVPLAVHENFRFQAPLLLAKQILDSGEIGEANWARINFRTAHDIYTGQPYLRTEEKLVINDLGVHVLDVARVFLGEAKHISAETQRRRTDIAGEDTATMLVRHESGAVSVVECTYEAHRLPDLFPQVLLELEGTRGSIVVKANYEVVVTTGGAARTIMAEPVVQPWMRQPWNVVQDSVVATCAHILAAYRAGEMPSVSAADNVKTIALCEAAYQAAETGVSVRPRA